MEIVVTQNIYVVTVLLQTTEYCYYEKVILLVQVTMQFLRDEDTKEVGVEGSEQHKRYIVAN